MEASRSEGVLLASREALIPSSIVIYVAPMTRYVFVCGFGDLSSNLVESGFLRSLTRPIRIVLLRDGVL